MDNGLLRCHVCREEGHVRRRVPRGRADDENVGLLCEIHCGVAHRDARGRPCGVGRCGADDTCCGGAVDEAGASKLDEVSARELTGDVLVLRGVLHGIPFPSPVSVEP